MFKGKVKKGMGDKKGKPFTLHHCWAKLENNEKWNNYEIYEGNKRIPKSSVGYATIVFDDEEASSGEGKEASLPTQLLRPRGLME
jgi:hypothetical protein